MVSNPGLSGSAIARFVVYEVLPTGMSDPEVVLRRYKDFEWLRNCLQNTYAGLLLPALPSKASPSDSKDLSSPFIKTRMAHLEIFMKNLAKIPFLIGDPAIEAFVTVPIGSGWDAKKVELDAIPFDKMEERSEGYKQWGIMLNDVDMEDEETLLKLIAEVKVHIGGLCAKLTEIDTTWTSVTAAGDNMDKALSSMSRTTNQWRDFEAQAVGNDSDSKKLLSHLSGDVMARVSNTTAMMVEQWRNEVSHVRDMIKNEMLGCMITQDAMAKGMFELIKMREMHFLAVEKEMALLDRKDGQKSRQDGNNLSVFDAIKGRTKETVSRSLDKHARMLDEAVQKASRISKAMYFCEIDRFGMMREVEIETAINNIILMNKGCMGKDQDKWTLIENTVELPPDFKALAGKMDFRAVNEGGCCTIS